MTAQFTFDRDAWYGYLGRELDLGDTATFQKIGPDVSGTFDPNSNTDVQELLFAAVNDVDPGAAPAIRVPQLDPAGHTSLRAVVEDGVLLVQVNPGRRWPILISHPTFAVRDYIGDGVTGDAAAKATLLAIVDLANQVVAEMATMASEVAALNQPAAPLNGPVADLTLGQVQLAAAANDLLRAIDQLVPGNVAHWAVEEARNAARVLAGRIGEVHTADWKRAAS